jgi:hypothetical protein
VEKALQALLKKNLKRKRLAPKIKKEEEELYQSSLLTYPNPLTAADLDILRDIKQEENQSLDYLLQYVTQEPSIKEESPEGDRGIFPLARRAYDNYNHNFGRKGPVYDTPEPSPKREESPDMDMEDYSFLSSYDAILGKDINPLS